MAALLESGLSKIIFRFSLNKKRADIGFDKTQDFVPASSQA